MKYTFKLRQHIGVPSEPAVKPGDKVQRGEKIAKRPKESLGANIFSSVDGVVTEVDDDHIIVEEDRLFKVCKTFRADSKGTCRGERTCRTWRCRVSDLC